MPSFTQMPSTGNLIWGRGSADDKSGLIGILCDSFVIVLLNIAKYSRSAMETMLVNGYQPARTVVLASGFDEESSGTFVRRTRCMSGLTLRCPIGCKNIGIRATGDVWRKWIRHVG